MTRLVHLSDLHFGFHREALIAPLLDRIAEARPELVVITGDLTHRALEPQMEEAARFLDRIEAPTLIVPGNHDIPLLNPLARMLWPFRGYLRHFGGPLGPVAQAGDVRVLGVNSADPFAWQRGLFRRGEIGRLIGGIDPQAMNVVALHHPLEQLPTVQKRTARRADEAASRLQDAGVGIALSGHLHIFALDELLATNRFPGLLQLQAGTALCARISDLQNEFAVLDIAPGAVRLERHVAPMNREGFAPPEIRDYALQDGRWARV
ncbi:metallophosphoesterase [Paracoccus sp. 1_MG-2023]|uniref:metallophosphoesterase family protein n=1 Tax=unclassified Paracoccus (in: a-proteobacteria) TaxID=2688777 RepID=UPI001C0864E0|nr:MULTISPECIES: metallophosphoesterase [unclassified Paracoccus (in: a-proteobacteria)]MBU2958619.1 metallophosphoesterase [Paracoccus sp. C2R09]MDO6667612.1 metallophosphoesterase [Paracoccus sp. 1_MG-2023]